MSNTFGKQFKITTFGESHGPAIGVVIDGCPAGLEISREEIQTELDRRRPGQSELVTPRDEKDQVEVLSGIFENQTLGTPICLLIRNENAQAKDYDKLKDVFRPGHADFTYQAKYGIRDYRGGGRASGRETAARVAAGAIAKKILAGVGIEITGRVVQVGKITDEKDFVKEIEAAKVDGDSVGGVVEVIARGVPVGLGEPVFDKLSAVLAHAFMSIPAVKGFEIGDGFSCVEKFGSENNDEFVDKGKGEGGKGKVVIGTKSNHAGGILGGISTGEDIVVRVAFKPTSSISKKQQTFDRDGNEAVIEVKGRHDPCVCLRAMPVGEAMMAMVLADHYLLSRMSRL
ncbi:MAG: chorismate synthase [Patescibacteria group bacterium]